MIKIVNRTALFRGKKIDHPNILKISKLYEDSWNLYIITDFSSTKELYDEVLQELKFLEEKAQKCMKQILEAVAYLHTRSILL